MSHLARSLRTRRFSEPTFRPSRATNHRKTQWIATFLPFRAPASSFSFSSLISSLLLFSSLTLPTSAFPSLHIVGSLTSKFPSSTTGAITATTITTATIAQKLRFLQFHLSVWGKSRAKASLSHLELFLRDVSDVSQGSFVLTTLDSSFAGSLARKVSFRIFDFQFLRETVPNWTSTVRVAKAAALSCWEGEKIRWDVNKCKQVTNERNRYWKMRWAERRREDNRTKITTAPKADLKCN